MAKREFDISAVLGKQLAGVSKLDTVGREQLEYIDIDLLDEDDRNFYDLPGIEELAANIQLCGLLQPLRVRELEGGRYQISAGHRRRAALALLVQEGHEEFRQVPAIVERSTASPAMQELRLIFANANNRVLKGAELARQAERVELLLYQLKEEGVEFPGRMRDQVAVACQTSAAKLGRLKVIRENLVPEYLALFEAEKLPEQAAYALARLPREFQARLVSALKEPPTGSEAESLHRRYTQDGWRWEPTFACPDGKPCKRGDTFLRHDVECVSYEQCGGTKCCLDCSRGLAESWACERACSRVKTLKKEKRDQAAAAAEARERKEQEKLQKKVRASAQRLLAAIDAAGLEDSVQLGIRRYGNPLTVSKIRDYAAGRFDGVHFYGNDLDPAGFSDVGALAKKLHCSADYILGLTDDLGAPAPDATAEADPEPEALPATDAGAPPSEDEVRENPGEAAPLSGQMVLSGWMPGGTRPAHEGRVAALYTMEGNPEPVCKALYYARGAFRFGTTGALCDLEPDAWIALPEDPPEIVQKAGQKREERDDG